MLGEEGDGLWWFEGGVLLNWVRSEGRGGVLFCGKGRRERVAGLCGVGEVRSGSLRVRRLRGWRPEVWSRGLYLVEF